MHDEDEKPHLPGVDSSKANDESLLRTHAQIRRRGSEEGSPVMFFAMVVLIIVFTFGWFYGRRYMADFDSTGVLAEREQIYALNDYMENVGAEPVVVVVDGAQLYAQQCMACHQTNGAGVAGAFPPLAGSEWVVNDPELPIKILLNGLGGPIEVKGNSYNGAMPAFGAAWSDAEIAATLTYIRTSWENEASEVTPEQVAEVRAAVGTRGAWTAEELAEYF